MRLSYAQKKQLPLLIVTAIVLMIAVAGLAMLVVQSMSQATADAFGCYEDAPQKKTLVLIDSSEPRWDQSQKRALDTYFSRLYPSLDFNEKLMVFTTEGDQISSILTPRFHVCGQAQSPEQLKMVGAPEAQAGYLKRQRTRFYQEYFTPQLEAILTLNPNDKRRQKYESPMLESIKSITRSYPLATDDHLVIVSDFIQNSDSAQFCVKQGHMPAFATFKKRRLYAQRFKPGSLEGVTVDALVLQRAGFGQKPYLPYCVSEQEVETFWTGYFRDNGVSAPQFIRLRHGYGG